MDITEVKSLLKTYCKQNHYKTPKYRNIFITGEDYKKVYTISVEIKGVLTVADSGISRRIAEKKAAIKALVELKVINKEDVDNTEDEVILNNNDINTQSKSEESPNFKKEVTAGDTELDPIVRVKVNEVSENSKNIILIKPSAKVMNKGIELKFMDENVSSQPKKAPNPSVNENKVETKAYNNNGQHLKKENISQLDENPICALIKYCLRNGNPLPFYDFSFSDGQFTTQCRVETKSTEFIGFGKSSTLRVAKMVASQEVIDELKKVNLYFSGSKQIVPVEETQYNIKSTGITEDKYTEYSMLTINLKSGEKTNQDYLESTPKTSPTKENFEEFEDFDRNYNSSTFGSRDDNNNQKDSRFDTTYEQNYKLIIDNPIAYLQKYCSKNKIPVPKYEEEARTGQDHSQIFWYKCNLETKDRDIIGIGGGNSKKTAKKAAAEEVVRLLLNL